MSSEAITRNDLKNILGQLGAVMPMVSTATNIATAKTGYSIVSQEAIVYGVVTRARVWITKSDSSAFASGRHTVATFADAYKPKTSVGSPISATTTISSSNNRTGYVWLTTDGTLYCDSGNTDIKEFYADFLYIRANGADTLYSVGMTPYIVETGTSGIWTYRKWSDGTAECWGKATGLTLTWSTYTSTGLYYGNATQTLPFAFTSTSCVVNANVAYVGGNVGWVANANLSNTSTVNMTLVRNGNSGTAEINIYVIGKWK